MSNNHSKWWSELVRRSVEEEVSAEYLAWKETERLRDENKAAWDSAEHNAQRARDADKRIEELMKIVMEVSTKYPGETRAETARRYVRERENRTTHGSSRALDGEVVSDE